MRFEWDEKKAKTNFEKHGIRFEHAQVIWSDPQSIDLVDDFENEERFIKIGLNILKGILLVVYCEKEDGEFIRLISARKANSFEKGFYEKKLRS